MEVKQIDINDLKFAEYNPRAASEKEVEDLKESLKRFGFVEPIVVNSAPERKNIIIGGHFRVRVAKDMGVAKIPVVYVSISDIKKEQELNLRLNKNLGHWDYDLLANYDEEMLLDIGWEGGELDEIFGLDIDEDFDMQAELEKLLKGRERRVKDGDLWQLGEHQLVIGDCTKRENWEKVMGEERFDFMFTDPPYKLAYARKLKKTKMGGGFGYKQRRKYSGVEQRGGIAEYDEWLSIANEFQNQKGANIMVFENWSNTKELWNAMEKYWKIRNMVIWHTPNRCQGFTQKHHFYQKYDIIILGEKGETKLQQEYEQELDNYLAEKGQKFLDTNEIILYGRKGNAAWDKKKGTKWARINDHITSAVETSASGQNIIFGTKPIQILVPYIKILSPRNGIVAEPFGGSGSTLIGCEIMKRRCRAMEIEPIYGEVILARWEKLTGKKAVRIKQ